MSISPHFITLDGIDGVGKTTFVPIVCEILQSYNLPVLSTREPGGTEIGEQLRSLLLQGPPVHSDTEILLMFAARAEHLQQVIRPALANGQWVVCDRFTDATYAYQGAGRGILKERIAQLETWVQGDLRPDLTLLLDAPPNVSLQRIKQRYSWEERFDQDRFEQEQIQFFSRVRQGYLTLAKAHPERYYVINATLAIEVITEQIKQVLHPILVAGAHLENVKTLSSL
jgi:dTMP kinase